MRAPGRRVGRQAGEQLVGVHRQAVGGHPLPHRPHAGPARDAQALLLGDDLGVGGVEQVAQEMGGDRAAAPVGAHGGELGAAHQDMPAGTAAARGVPPGGGVVVGQPERRDAGGAATATSAAGESVPSEASEWVWISITEQPLVSPSRAQRPRRGRDSMCERVWRLSPNTSSEMAS